MLNPEKISFKQLELEDIHLMQKWLNEPHVHEWYDKDKENTLEKITERYGLKIKGEKPTTGYIVSYDEKPVGYIQTCHVNDYPEFGPYLGYDDYTASVDLFIGEVDFMGKGFGYLMLKKFLADIVFAEDEITTCIIDPDPNNIRAIKSYEKAGFKFVKNVQLPTEPAPFYIMELKKENFTP